MSNDSLYDKDVGGNPRIRGAVKRNFQIFKDEFQKIYKNYLMSLQGEMDLAFLSSYGKKEFEKEMKSLEQETLGMIEKVSEGTTQEIYEKIAKSVDDPNII